jgi:hypothetical protein
MFVGQYGYQVWGKPQQDSTRIRRQGQMTVPDEPGTCWPPVESVQVTVQARFVTRQALMLYRRIHPQANCRSGMLTTS